MGGWHMSKGGARPDDWIPNLGWRTLQAVLVDPVPPGLDIRTVQVQDGVARRSRPAMKEESDQNTPGGASG